MTDAENDPTGVGGEESNPRARLMQEVAEQMDAIEADFGDGYQIGRVITIVEVIQPDGNVGIRVRASQLPWVTLGLLDWAKIGLEEAARRGAQGE